MGCIKIPYDKEEALEQNWKIYRGSVGGNGAAEKNRVSAYRYGFNGKEKDSHNEFGQNNHYDYGFRIYNPAIGKFLSVDPLTKEYPWYTPYQFAGNKPIWAIDLDGLEELIASDGKLLGSGPFNDETRTRLLNEHSVRRALGEQQKILLPNSTWLDTPVGTQIVRSGDNIKVSQFNVYEELINTTVLKAVGRSANQRDVTDFSADILAGVAREINDDEIIITSTFRDPENQARVMYDNLKKKGVASQRSLYRNGKGGDVINVFEIFNNDPNCSSQECKKAMELTIRQVGPGNVSKHAEDPDVLNTIDISPKSVNNNNYAEFVKKLRKNKSIRKVVTPPNDPALHTEVKQPDQKKY